jgi:hypothetical protein
MHNEFVVEFKDGTRDWVDPVYGEVHQTEDHIFVTNHKYTYNFEKSKVAKWAVRPYSPDTTYDPI